MSKFNCCFQSSAVFEAEKKLASIKRAEDNAVTAEELIRFAHRISASGAVAAPPTWVPGRWGIIWAMLFFHHVLFQLHVYVKFINVSTLTKLNQSLLVC